MRKIYTTIFAVLILASCESENSIEETDFESGVLSGRIRYVDLSTDETISDNDSIQIELKSIGSEPANIPVEINRMPKGFQFEFGPLNYGTYSVEAKFEDTDSGIEYMGEISATLSNTNNRHELEILLEPQNQTIIIGELVNNSEAPVVAADLFLYNDTTFLKQFKGAGGFVNMGTSNKLGRTVFSGHQEGEYYVLGRLIIEEDTLFSKMEGLVPTSVLPLEITKVQSQFEIE